MVTAMAGSRARPVIVALRPSRCWKYTLAAKIMP